MVEPVRYNFRVGKHALCKLFVFRFILFNENAVTGNVLIDIIALVFVIVVVDDEIVIGNGNYALGIEQRIRFARKVGAEMYTA